MFSIEDGYHEQRNSPYEDPRKLFSLSGKAPDCDEFSTFPSLCPVILPAMLRSSCSSSCECLVALPGRSEKPMAPGPAGLCPPVCPRRLVLSTGPVLLYGSQQDVTSSL